MRSRCCFVMTGKSKYINSLDLNALRDDETEKKGGREIKNNMR